MDPEAHLNRAFGRWLEHADRVAEHRRLRRVADIARSSRPPHRARSLGRPPRASEFTPKFLREISMRERDAALRDDASSLSSTSSTPSRSTVAPSPTPPLHAFFTAFDELPPEL